MKLNNETKWGLGIGVALATLAIFAMGIESDSAMGILFYLVVGGAYSRMVARVKGSDWLSCS